MCPEENDLATQEFVVSLGIVAVLCSLAWVFG
jgi:hypothetical protein